MSDFQSITSNQSIYEGASTLTHAKGTKAAEQQAAQAFPETGAKPAASSDSRLQPKSPTVKTKLKFQVDQDSNDVTVLILDASSHEVIRTVPPEELSKLTPGELIDLTR